jgi:hypothetical protein
MRLHRLRQLKTALNWRRDSTCFFKNPWFGQQNQVKNLGLALEIAVFNKKLGFEALK